MTSLPRTVPATWYTSDKFIEASREKIYNRGWHFVSTINALSMHPELNDGLEDALQLNFVGNPFFGVCNVDDPYKATSVDLRYGVYEDVVRGCKTKEEKAAKIAELPTVNHVVTEGGLIFVCHEKTPAKSFKEYFGNELGQFIDGKDFRSRSLRRRLVYECDYNYLTFIDGYQECLHCQYTHPGFSKVYPFEFYKVDPYTNFCRHHCNPVGGSKDEGLFLYFFPSCTLNQYGGGMGIFRANPVNGNKTRMEFEYFFDGNDEEFEAYFKFARQVALEDIWLCEAAQQNLVSGIYQQGVLHPSKEVGVVFYQSLIRDRIMAQ
ncbi:hypothetical protein OGAPHI_005924 [Ogataea philodendri]|uniref:Choline monooxygenase, chloroplastic n=1 Tax=Ogataea philodendri TaxID=1378263 RepID=A0A9P8T1J3_9ASCO|nr:uncharacterized protein OGAPHI_005924 [Ogataea philodendri]KAH3661746.1 hypothetical protein OGAPHI_005924 [Ogataea philodendri]